MNWRLKVKRILILGASALQIPLINKANEMGFETIALDFNSEAPGASFATEFFQISTIDLEKTLEIAREKKISGIVTSSDFPVRTVAFVSEKLGLCGVSVKVAEICTNKHLQREYLKKGNFLYPKFKLTKGLGDLKKIHSWDFPLIVKPIDSSGSRGVQKVTSAADLITAYELAVKSSRNGEVIIEEFIGGKEYSVEILIQDKLIHIVSITEKVTSGQGDKFFVEESHIIPAHLYPSQEEEIKKVIIDFINLIGMDNCAAHVEFKLNVKGVYIIEIAARLGGDFITSDLVPASTGVDMLGGAIAISIGQKIDTKPKKCAHAGIHFLTPDNYEKGINRFQEIKNNINVLRIVQQEKKSDASLQSSFDRLGYIIAVADSRKELDVLLDF
jgi:carbamoyl-phosphate synthase large subunit